MIQELIARLRSGCWLAERGDPAIIYYPKVWTPRLSRPRLAAGSITLLRARTLRPHYLSAKEQVWKMPWNEQLTKIYWLLIGSILLIWGLWRLVAGKWVNCDTRVNLIFKIDYYWDNKTIMLDFIIDNRVSNYMIITFHTSHRALLRTNITGCRAQQLFSSLIKRLSVFMKRVDFKYCHAGGDPWKWGEAFCWWLCSSSWNFDAASPDARSPGRADQLQT